MSADNGVYILRTKVGMKDATYRVAYIQGLQFYEYVDFYTGQVINNDLDKFRNYLREVWSDCNEFDADTAIQVAITMNNYLKTEYGIVVLNNRFVEL